MAVDPTCTSCGTQVNVHDQIYSTWPFKQSIIAMKPTPAELQHLHKWTSKINELRQRYGWKDISDLLLTRTLERFGQCPDDADFFLKKMCISHTGIFDPQESEWTCCGASSQGACGCCVGPHKDVEIIVQDYRACGRCHTDVDVNDLDFQMAQHQTEVAQDDLSDEEIKLAKLWEGEISSLVEEHEWTRISDQAILRSLNMFKGNVLAANDYLSKACLFHTGRFTQGGEWDCCGSDDEGASGCHPGSHKLQQ